MADLYSILEIETVVIAAELIEIDVRQGINKEDDP